MSFNYNSCGLCCFVCRIIHIICTLVFQFTILRDIERMAGWLRIAIIYLFSGIGGYLISAILIPYQVEVRFQTPGPGSLSLSLPRSKRKFSQPLKDKYIREVVRIDSTIIFHLSKLWKAELVLMLCGVIFLVRLQGKFEIDHSWEWRG